MKPAGIPLEGPLNATFSLYGAASGGSPIWSETLTVNVTKGLVSTTLGATNPLSLPFDSPRYVGVSVNGDPEMSPRVPLAAVPFALALPNVNVDSAGNVGIGVARPFGAFDLAVQVPTSSTDAVLDQTDSSYSTGILGPPGYVIAQSFRPAYTGLLSSVNWRMSLAAAGSFTATISLYAGNAPVGTPIQASSVSNSASDSKMYLWGLSGTSWPVTAGQEYTVAFSTDTTAVYAVDVNEYPYGMMYAGGTPVPVSDMYFQTWVRPSGGMITEHAIVVTNPTAPDAGSMVGIGTLKPTFPLSVRSNGVGSWISLKNLADDTSWMLYGDSTALNIAPGSGLGAVLTADDKLGIGVYPSYQLDVLSRETKARLVSTNASNGSVLELKNLAPGSVTLGAINFADAGGFYPGQIAYNEVTPAANLAFRVGSSERLRITDVGNVGINQTNPGFPLTFASSVGDKIALYTAADGVSTVGLGVQANLLQVLGYKCLRYCIRIRLQRRPARKHQVYA
jgi:hypothetical protein